MKKIEIYDPPMCCSTGICGPSVDPRLTRFAADLDWLKKKGLEVTRFNLAQQPGAFVHNAGVRAELGVKGNSCLPLIVIEGAIAASGGYPDRGKLAELAGVTYDPVQDGSPAPAAAFTLPMAATGACCPTPDAGPPIEAAGDFCPWPRQTNGGCC